MRSASLFINTPRSAALILRHGPLSNAARAAATALSTSAASDSATCVITSPVDGLIVGKVFPDTLLTHWLLMSNFVALILTFGSITVVAVAILKTSFMFVCASPSLHTPGPVVEPAGMAGWVRSKCLKPRRGANFRRKQSVYLRAVVRKVPRAASSSSVTPRIKFRVCGRVSQWPVGFGGETSPY